MGTSSSYGGPGGKGGSLLPPWAPPADDGSSDGPGSPADSPPGEAPGVVPYVSWGATKARLARFASAGGARSKSGAGNLRAAGRNFVAAQGGSRRAAHTAASGRASAQRLGSFLGAVASVGARAAADAFGLGGFVGQSAEILLAAAVDRLAPDGAQLEQAAARAALTDTLAEVFQERGVFDGGLEALQGLTPADAREILTLFVAHYINERLIQVLAKKLEDRPAQEVVRLESEVWSYVQGTVILDLSSLDVLATDWTGPEGEAVIDRIFVEGYRIIEKP